MVISEGAILAGIEATIGTIKFIASKANPKIRENINKWKTKQNAETLRTNIRQIGNISTIASKKSSTIDEIYFPAKILIPKGSSRLITHAADLFIGKSRIALILGTAGQGKSVFLRYLCLQDLELEGKIPIFIELRRIDKDKNLHHLLREQLMILGLIEADPEEITALLLESGKCRLFLDGYDEISREYSLRTKAEINQLLASNKLLEVAITSRPGAISQHLRDSFDIAQHEIAPISSQDHSAFFSKIGVDAETRTRLLLAIERSRAEIRNLLSTPLMLTLLVITCAGQQELPDTLPEFYDSLFNVLASTHDGTKPGYTRQKATSLSNSELERLFSAFCFVSKSKFRRNSLTIRQMEEALEKSKEISNTKCTTEGFRTEVTETVCLMLSDGLETAFIHKSIQEYYSARFIHTLDNKNHAEIILRNISATSLFEWNNELQFLEDFRDRTYENTIGSPHAVQLIESLRLKNKTGAVSWVKLKRFIQTSKISVGRYRESKSVSSISWPNLLEAANANRYTMNLTVTLTSAALKSFPIASKQPSITDSLEVVQLVDLANQNTLLKNALISAAEKYCDDLEKKHRAMNDRQNRQDAGLLSILA